MIIIDHMHFNIIFFEIISLLDIMKHSYSYFYIIFFQIVNHGASGIEIPLD